MTTIDYVKELLERKQTRHSYLKKAKHFLKLNDLSNCEFFSDLAAREHSSIEKLQNQSTGVQL